MSKVKEMKAEKQFDYHKVIDAENQRFEELKNKKGGKEEMTNSKTKVTTEAKNQNQEDVELVKRIAGVKDLKIDKTQLICKRCNNNFLANHKRKYCDSCGKILNKEAHQRAHQKMLDKKKAVAQ